ncbi:MAG: hypothetical protein P8M12_06055 [Flavobacteriales bacterium]|jgi:hypothetical protein|nr:hypothetical protein [Flavobacteriales bacterium]
MHNFKCSYILLFFIVFLFSCNETSNYEKDSNLNSQPIDTIIEIQDSHVENIYFNVPTPMETAYILKKAGAIYDFTLPLDPNKAQNDYTSEEQALLLGLYGSDLNYTIVSSKNQETMFYLNSTKILGEKLGLGNILNEEVKARVEQNINSKDSMQVIISDLFWKVEMSLKDDDRESISALIVAGGWIEGLYIATQISNQMQGNQEIKSIICQQKYSSRSVLELLKNNRVSNHTLETVIEPLEEINSAFAMLELEDKTIKNNETLSSGTLLINDDVISDVRLIIEQIRTDITH